MDLDPFTSFRRFKLAKNQHAHSLRLNNGILQKPDHIGASNTRIAHGASLRYTFQMESKKIKSNRKMTFGAEVLVTQVSGAIDDLPIQARLEFAQNLLFSNGGNKNALQPNAALILVHDVIGDVIGVLERHPRAAQLRTPEHKP